MQTLATEAWVPSSIDAVVLALLDSEWDKRAIFSRFDRRLVTQADIRDPEQNEVRRMVLDLARAPLFRHIPEDTNWFHVQSLRRAHFGQLHVIARCGWDDPADRNELEAVAKRKPITLQVLNKAMVPVLWGHAADGPLVILDGNHRLLALAANAASQNFEATCLVGLSPQFCAWHIFDNAQSAGTIQPQIASIST